MYRKSTPTAVHLITFLVGTFVFSTIGAVGCSQQPTVNQGTIVQTVETNVQGSAFPNEAAKAPTDQNDQLEMRQQPTHELSNKLAQPKLPTLTVALSGVKKKTGVYACGLFSNQEDFERRENPVKSAELKASQEPVVWKIENLPQGEYAIAVFHDENQNGKLDRHAFGYPLEKYGFSNNARGKMGPPPYEKTKFEISDGPHSMTVELK